MTSAKTNQPCEGVAWALPTLTEVTYGCRKGELYVVGSGVGVGKSVLSKAKSNSNLTIDEIEAIGKLHER